MVRNAFGFAACTVLCFILFSLPARAATHSAGAESNFFEGDGGHDVLDFDLLALEIPSRSLTISGDSFDCNNYGYYSNYGLWNFKPIPSLVAPAPGSAVLFAVGLTILGATRRRRRRNMLLSSKPNKVKVHLDPGLHEQSETQACATQDAGGGMWKRIQRSKRD